MTHPVVRAFQGLPPEVAPGWGVRTGPSYTFWEGVNPPVESLIDLFGTFVVIPGIDPNVWVTDKTRNGVTSGASVILNAGGQVEFSNPTSGANADDAIVYSKGIFDLRGSTIEWLTTFPTALAATTTYGSGVVLCPPPAHDTITIPGKETWIGIRNVWNGSTINEQADAFFQGVNQATGSITSSADNWYRIRESNGTIFFESAPDNGQVLSKPVPPWSSILSIATATCKFDISAVRVAMLYRVGNSNTANTVTVDFFQINDLPDSSGSISGSLVERTDVTSGTLTAVAGGGLSGAMVELPDTSSGTLTPVVGLAGALIELRDVTASTVTPVVAVAGALVELADRTSGTLTPVVGLTGSLTELADITAATLTPVVGLSGALVEQKDIFASALTPNVGLAGTMVEQADLTTAVLAPVVGLDGTLIELPDVTSASIVQAGAGSISGAVIELPDITAGTLTPFVDLTGVLTEQLDVISATTTPVVAVDGVLTELPDVTATTLTPVVGLAGAMAELAEATSALLAPIVGLSGAIPEQTDTSAATLLPLVDLSSALFELPDLTSGVLSPVLPAAVLSDLSEEPDLTSGTLDAQVDLSGDLFEDYDLTVSLIGDAPIVVPSVKSHTDLYIRQFLEEYYDREWQKKPPKKPEVAEPVPSRVSKPKAGRVRRAVEQDPYLLLEPAVMQLAAKTYDLGESLASLQLNFTVQSQPSESDEDEDLLLLSSVL